MINNSEWWSIDDYGNEIKIDSNIPIVKSVTKDVLPEYETTISSDIKSLGVAVGDEASKDIATIKSSIGTALDFAKLLPFAFIIGGIIYLKSKK